MNEIVFDTDFINKYFKTKTNTDKIYIENIKKIPYIPLKGRGEKITQHDLDLLMNFAEVSLIDIDLNGLCFKDNDKNSLKRLKLLGKKDYDLRKVIQDYPNYEDLPLQERYNIISDEKYAVYPDLKITGLSNLNTVTYLLINGYNISEETRNEISKMKRLRKLIINGNVEKDAGSINEIEEKNSALEKNDDEKKEEKNEIKEIEKVESKDNLQISVNKEKWYKVIFDRIISFFHKGKEQKAKNDIG